MAAAAGQPNGEELTGRFWVARQIIQKCLASNEQLVIFSEHLANLDDIASLLKKVPHVHPSSLCFPWKAQESMASLRKCM